MDAGGRTRLRSCAQGDRARAFRAAFEWPQRMGKLQREGRDTSQLAPRAAAAEPRQLRRRARSRAHGGAQPFGALLGGGRGTAARTCGAAAGTRRLDGASRRMTIRGGALVTPLAWTSWGGPARSAVARRGQVGHANGDARLRLQQPRERRAEFLAAARIAPSSVVAAKMKPAAFRGNPDFAIRHMAVDDDAASVFALDRQDAVLQIPVEVGVARFERRIEREPDLVERRVGDGNECGFFHDAMLGFDGPVAAIRRRGHGLRHDGTSIPVRTRARCRADRLDARRRRRMRNQGAAASCTKGGRHACACAAADRQPGHAAGHDVARFAAAVVDARRTPAVSSAGPGGGAAAKPQTWGDHATGFARVDDELCAECVPLSVLAERFGTPCYVYSRAMLASAYERFDAAFAGLPHLVCYAMKANPSLAILDLFAQLGAGFDIVSGGELERVAAAGGDARKVVFSGIGKSDAEMEAALAAGILCFNVESAGELDHLAAVAARMGKQAPISFRVNPDVDPLTHPYISTGLKQSKFGVAFDEAHALYRKAARLPSIAVRGIDMHIGSQI